MFCHMCTILIAANLWCSVIIFQSMLWLLLKCNHNPKYLQSKKKTSFIWLFILSGLRHIYISTCQYLRCFRKCSRSLSMNSLECPWFQTTRKKSSKPSERSVTWDKSSRNACRVSSYCKHRKGTDSNVFSSQSSKLTRLEQASYSHYD